MTLSEFKDPDKITSILFIAVITLLILLVLNIYKVHSLKRKIKSMEQE